MIFAAIPIDQAEGLVLAHTTNLGAAKLIKGRQLKAEDIAMLRRSNVATVTACRMEAQDLGENEAADRVATALAGPTIMAGPASAGRCNLFAHGHGLLMIDRGRIERLNRVDEAVAVATLPPWSVVVPRQRVATVKIIPFAVDRAVVATCAEGMAEALHIRPFRAHRVGLISTTMPQMNEALVQASTSVNRARIEALGGVWGMELRCAHDVHAIERSIRQVLDGGCTLVLIAGAVMTTDRRDIIPSAIIRSGGAIVHFGMPVEPGNMLMLASIGAVPLLSLPGCTRSASPNGLDWILPRVMADLPVIARDIMDMGVGGLLAQGAE
jgi:molybdenum cofactor cytidylyltransferase